MNRRFVVSENGRLACFVSGKNSNPAVVFLHGNSSSSRAFQALFEGALKEYFNLVAFDFPGHGESDAANDPVASYCIPQLISCVKSIVEATGVSSFILVGNSLGGHIAIESSVQLPGCKGIMIFGAPPAKFPFPDDLFLPGKALSLFFKGELTDAEAEELARQGLASDLWVSAMSRDILRTDIHFRDTIAASYGSENGIQDEIQIVHELKIPVAILNGAKDRFMNLNYLEKLSVPSLWKKKIHLIQDAGHYPSLEQPEALTKLILEFSNDVFSGL